MEIVWYGHSCFRITERGSATLVTDPFDAAVTGYSPLKLKADIVTVSCDEDAHNFTKAVKGDPYLIHGPGEYEIGNVFVTGLRVGHAKDEPVRNTIYLINIGAFTVAHLGHMTQTPNQSDIESLGSVNIALVPVGDGASLNASKAAEVISMLEPNIVIPMMYETPQSKMGLDPLSKFLKEMGLTQLETMESYKVTSTSGFNEEETYVIALDPKISQG